jgi:hypothetical protein
MPGDPAIELEYTFTCTGAPVQAEGTIMGRRFYFRARNDSWRFAVSEDADLEPCLVSETDMDDGHGFLCCDLYGDGPYAASWMPLKEAERIIAMCAREYLEAATS